jgi:hypothetical protein
MTNLMILIMRLLGLAAFVLGAAVPAWAAGPATDLTGWLCEIDLSAINRPPGTPASVFTFDTRKHCPANPPSESVTIECKANIPGWTGPSSTNSNVPCQINGDQCGVDGFFTAVGSSLNINSDGSARLFCKFAPPPL